MAQSKRDYTAEREHRRAYMRAYYKANKDQFAAYHKRNRSKILRKQRQYREAHKERLRAQCRAYYAANRSQQQARNKAWKAAHPEHKKVAAERQRAKLYGLTVVQLRLLLKRGCAICGARKNLHIDHCHKKGSVRAALCGHCNGGIGFFKEDVRLLRKAISYLKGHK